jgi:hypothetical protein
MEYIDVYHAYKWKIIWLLLPYCPLANSSGPTSKRQIKQASELLDCSQTVAPVIKSSTQWTPADGCFVSQDKGTSQCTTPSYVKETSQSLFVSNPVRNLLPEKGLTAMDAMGNGWIASTAMTLSVWSRVVGSGSTSKYWKDIEGMFQNNNQLPSVTNQLPT